MQKKIGTVFLLSLFLLSCVAETITQDDSDSVIACSINTQCASCAAQKGCGWCTAIEKCMPGSATGPTNATCIGTSWQYKSCKQCNQLYDCRSCKDFQSDCIWCEASKSCNPLGTPCSSGFTESCPCDIYQTCSGCMDDATCMWCGSSLTCMKATDNCQMPAHTCSCSLNTDCFSCMADYKCNWCSQTAECILLGNSTSGCIFSHNCNAFCNVLNSCTECQAQNGCAWCGLTNQCVEAETANCIISHTCPDCSQHKLCDTCLDTGACVWCNTGTCVPIGSNCQLPPSCNAYCNSSITCTGCTQKFGCGWCSETESCVNLENSGCLLTHTCDEPVIPGKCGFDGGAFVGGMFLVIGIVGLLVGGYIFYKWKTGKHIAYSELT